ncbi:serine/threonine-protein kinase [Actinomadura kijaniata]|uniref:serine/threonine-protein kinase n=1 Tax=Actinomadura kijaniata TaxID=46161 RepID=UPI00082A0A06|nr:serine/threonine-protein kinase [Actinomadura kijaniata]
MPRATPLDPRDPLRLGGHELVGRLGEGGQGVVYLGRAPDGTPVAVKVLHRGLVTRREDRRALANELAVAQRVEPFCTAQVLAADLDADPPYVVSEYVDGPSLAEAVRRDGPRTAGALHRLAVATVTALVAIHEAGIVHRDLKPANVLLGPDGPRVIDFGIARVQESTLSTTGRLMGTPAYMAPEQATGQRVTAAADMFAWAGVMTYAALGRPAFGTGTLPVVATRIVHGEPDLEGLAGPVRGLVEACLAKDPAERPSAHDVLMALLGAARRTSPLPEMMREAADLARPRSSPDPWEPPGRDTTFPPGDTSPPREPDTTGPPPRDRRAAGDHRWAWLVGALGVTVVGLGAVTFVALQSIRGGYYVGEENGQVVLYRGTTQEVPGISLSRKADAKDQPNPPIPLVDLPPTQRAAVKAKYEVKGPQAIRDLMNMVCRYGIAAESGKVVVVKGRGQDQCGTQRVTESPLALAELPLSDQTAIRDGRLTFVGRQAAERELTRLTARRDRCRDNPSTQGCP